MARDRIVPDIVRSLVAHRSVELRNLRTVRPWQHVLEPLAGYLTLAAAMLASDEPGLCGGWNFGPQHGDDATVEELASEFCVAWGLGEWQARSDATAPHETKILRLSIEKALFNLNWKPVWRFSEAVRRTVDWYRAFYARGGDVRDACWHDIQAYCEDASRQQAADIPWRDHKHIRAAS